MATIYHIGTIAALPTLFGAAMATKSLWEYYAHATRRLDLLSRTLFIARNIRALYFYRKHKSPLGLSTHCDDALSKLDAVRFHRFGRQGYLHSSFGVKECVDCILCHYRFEEKNFNSGYKSAVYDGKGLQLWAHSGRNNSFVLRLQRESLSGAEGELTISLSANGMILHRISFTWISGKIFEVPESSIPFITLSQRTSVDSAQALAAFKSCFENCTPDFFCIVAIQGIAQSLGVNSVLAINYDSQVTFDPKNVEQFQRAYDGFWKVLGAVRLRSSVWLLRTPFYTKPMGEIRSKNRKRTANRRRQWDAVGESTRVIIRNYLLPDSRNGVKVSKTSVVAEL